MDNQLKQNCSIIRHFAKAGINGVLERDNEFPLTMGKISEQNSENFTCFILGSSGCSWGMFNKGKLPAAAFSCSTSGFVLWLVFCCLRLSDWKNDRFCYFIGKLCNYRRTILGCGCQGVIMSQSENYQFFCRRYWSIDNFSQAPSAFTARNLPSWCNNSCQAA